MTTDLPPYSLTDTEVHSFYSSIVDQEYSVAVAFPRAYAPNDVTYPVLYVLDARAGFGTLVEAHRLMSLQKVVRDILLVGVGYAKRDFSETLSMRCRDFTPTDYPSFSEDSPKTAAYAQHGIGGAEDFFGFLSSELLPFVRDRYPVDHRDQGILGISFGGLFATYCLVVHPGYFKRYVICSPSLWWDSGVAFDYEKEYASKHSDLDAKVFLCVGELEKEYMVDNTRELSRILESRAYPSLKLTTFLFKGDTHVSVLGAAMWRRLREIYGADS